MQMVRLYRSKPTLVEAALVRDDNLHEISVWCGGYISVVTERPGVVVPTINGQAYAEVGHYVIKGPNDFYPCDPDTFVSRWEQATKDIVDA